MFTDGICDGDKPELETCDLIEKEKEKDLHRKRREFKKKQKSKQNSKYGKEVKNTYKNKRNSRFDDFEMED